MSSYNHSYLSYENGAYAFRRRNPRFSWEELQILAQETSKNFELLRQKETDDAVKQMKQRVWTVITEKVNAVNRSNSRREPLQLKRKWIEARSRVRHKLIASHRRRVGSQDSNASSGAPSSSSNGSAEAAAILGDSQRPSAAATPVELSYFEKLLTLSMSEELQDEEIRIANQHRQLRQPHASNQHPVQASHIPVPRQRAKMEEEEEADEEFEEGPSCLTMTPEEMGHENADVDMWTNHDDDELELLSLPRRRHNNKREDEETIPDTSGAATPVPDNPTAASRPCLMCGSGPSATFERMLAERHSYKLNILHNKSHYWYAKCRQVAPEAAIAPPSAAVHRNHSRLRPGPEVKPELFDVNSH